MFIYEVSLIWMKGQIYKERSTGNADCLLKKCPPNVTKCFHKQENNPLDNLTLVNFWFEQKTIQTFLRQDTCFYFRYLYYESKQYQSSLSICQTRFWTFKKASVTLKLKKLYNFRIKNSAWRSSSKPFVEIPKQHNIKANDYPGFSLGKCHVSINWVSK